MKLSPLFNLQPLSPVLDPALLRQLEPSWMAAAREIPEPTWMSAARALPEPGARRLLGPFVKLKVLPRVR